MAEPASSLSGFIFYYWLLYIEADQLSLEVIPDGALDLVVSPNLPDFSAVYPPSIQKFSIPLKGPIHYAGISFEPESAQQVLGQNIASLSSLEAGRETTEVLKLKRLVDAIQGVANINQLKQIFDRELSRKDLKHTKLKGQSIYDYFCKNLDAGGVRKVASELGMSERKFRRTSNDLSGLAPKQLQRIVRLQNLLHELFCTQEVASSDGYYDDSHRIREVKQLTGLTVGELRKMAEIYNKSKNQTTKL